MCLLAFLFLFIIISFFLLCYSAHTDTVVNVVGKGKNLHLAHWQVEHSKLVKSCKVLVSRLPLLISQQVSVTLRPDGQIDTEKQVKSPTGHHSRSGRVKKLGKNRKFRSVAVAARSSSSNSPPIEHEPYNSELVTTNRLPPIDSHQEAVVDDDVCFTVSDSSNEQQNGLSSSVASAAAVSQVSSSTTAAVLDTDHSRKRKLSEVCDDGGGGDGSGSGDVSKKGKICDDDNDKPAISVDDNALGSAMGGEEKAWKSPSVREPGSSMATYHRVRSGDTTAESSSHVVLNVSSSGSVTEEAPPLGSPQQGPHSNYSVQSCDSGVDFSLEKSVAEWNRDAGNEPGSPTKASPGGSDKKLLTGSSAVQLLEETGK